MVQGRPDGARVARRQQPQHLRDGFGVERSPLHAPGSDGRRDDVAGSGAATFPNNWLRLVRVGNTFTGYRSTDGTNWTQIGTVTLALPQTIFFGLAATSQNTTATTTAQFRDLAVAGSTPVDEAPAAPTNVTTSATTAGIALNWNDNSETDLDGYNVYRATSASGPWTSSTPPACSRRRSTTTRPHRRRAELLPHRRRR